MKPTTQARANFLTIKGLTVKRERKRKKESFLLLHGSEGEMMNIHLKVVKADGSTERYLHTKVLGTIANGLSGTGDADIKAAEELAEVVTYYLYRKRDRRTATSSEVFSIVKTVLAGTGYEAAAEVLIEHRFQRKLKRARTEVFFINTNDSLEPPLNNTEYCCRKSRWDKSRIVTDLIIEHNIERQMARTIASMVEEKIFNLNLTSVSTALIKQLVFGDATTMLRANQQLQMA